KTDTSFSSYSILEIPWEKNTSAHNANREHLTKLEQSFIVNNISNDKVSIDLLFYSYDIILPNILSTFEDLTFNYSFLPGNRIRILKDKLVIYEIEVYQIEEFIDQEKISTDLIFILGRNKLRNKCKTEEYKKYKECVLEEKEYLKEETLYDKIRAKIIGLQIERGINISYVESSADLIRELRSVIKSFTKEEYVPKVRKQNTTKGFLANLLEMVPGISRNATKSLAKYFDSLNDMISQIDTFQFQEVEIINEANSTKRKFGKKQSDLLKSFLGKI
ncbi:hypothetical protein H311_01886, partial [Anncaliia algerae PRA109]